MKFVSKYTYTLSILDGTKTAQVDPRGHTTYVEDSPSFSAVFTTRTLTHAEIEAAKEQFLEKQGPYAFGSIPGRDEGNINIQDAVLEGYSSTAFAGYDVYQNLTVFDTEDRLQCPTALKAEVEEFMLNHYELGQAYVRVDTYKVTPPWPTYPVNGDVNVAGVVGFAQQAGLLESALTYEQSFGRRQELIEALSAAVAEERKSRQEDAALTATV